MEKIKRYIECYVDTETCNLRCHYCYITQKRKFNSKLMKLPHPKEFIRKALSQQRLGGICLLNFCAGGETLLSDEVLPVVHELLCEGHYVMIVTNGTLTKRFEEISNWSEELRNRLIIKFSFHYLELKRLNILEKFFYNINLMKKFKISFTVEITPSDELIPYIEEIKNVCKEHLKTLCHVTIARDDRTNNIDILSTYDFEHYKEIWGQFHSELFDFKTTIFYKKRKEFCYAGDWSLYVNLYSGVVTQCYIGEQLGNIYQNIDEPIKFKAIGYGCPLPHCYNGHSFLTLGDIPELKTPTYAQMRNRVCEDGSEWLTNDVKKFFSSKLCESNKKRSVFYKMKLVTRSKINRKRTELSAFKYRILHKNNENL